MADQKDGGPAFPGVIRWPDGCKDRTETFDGMSLRDWFAGKALQWCLSEFGGNAEDQKQFAEAAYQIADAMLAERDRRREEFPR